MNNKKKGVFLSFEGPDACGKTTNTKFFVEELRKRGYYVVHTREPGGTPLGEEIRQLLLNNYMDKNTEALLFAAQRRMNMEQVILPTVRRGDVVVSERFADSSYAYQGVARNNVERILALEKWTVENCVPDYTLFLDITEEESEKRLTRRSTDTKLDVFEVEKREFRQDVYKGFQQRLAQFPERMVRIDAMVPLDAVQAALIQWIDTVFVPNHPIN